MSSRFQQATAADAADLSQMDLRIFGEDGFGPSTFRKEIEVGNCILFILEEEIAGYAMVRTEGGIHDLTRLAVHHAAQGAGVGRALLREARRQHPGTMILLVRKTNDRAKKLYLSEGFVIEGMTGSSWMMVCKD